MTTTTYELCQLSPGWTESTPWLEDRAIEAIKDLTGWPREKAEEMLHQAALLLALAEEQEKDQYCVKHNKYPRTIRCTVQIEEYSVSRKRVKPIHCSESSRTQYQWKKEKKEWIVFDNQNGTLVRKCRSLESAERYIAKELRSLQNSFGNGVRVCNTLSVCPPGSSVVPYSSIQGHRVGSGMPTYVSNP